MLEGCRDRGASFPATSREMENCSTSTWWDGQLHGGAGAGYMDLHCARHGGREKDDFPRLVVLLEGVVVGGGEEAVASFQGKRAGSTKRLSVE